MTTWIFKPTHVFWPEMATLVTGTFLFWEHHRDWQGLTTEPVLVLGNYCQCIRLRDASQFRGVTQGLRDLDECRFATATKPPPRQAPPPASQDNQFIRNLMQIALGSAFERAKLVIRGKWGVRHEDHSKWPCAVLTAYHVRNGAFHGNTFTFDKKPTFPPPWHGLEISKSLKGKRVMGIQSGRLGLADVVALLHDLAEEIGHV